jgi:predicted NUDIX family NTP pyrophosphohydrolase
MGEQSAGILAYRRTKGRIEVLLVHPGGPFWAKRDVGAWSIPKGLFEAAEEPLEAAQREFQEETGQAIEGEFLPLGWIKQPGGKTVHAWAVETDFDPAGFQSNMFELEWPPKSGRMQEFPEVDRVGWFSLATATEKILKGQREFLDRLVRLTGDDSE